VKDPDQQIANIHTTCNLHLLAVDPRFQIYFLYSEEKITTFHISLCYTLRPIFRDDNFDAITFIVARPPPNFMHDFWFSNFAMQQCV